MNYKAILLSGAFTAWILSETIPAVQVWLPASLIVMAALYAAQRASA